MTVSEKLIKHIWYSTTFIQHIRSLYFSRLQLNLVCPIREQNKKSLYNTTQVLACIMVSSGTSQMKPQLP